MIVLISHEMLTFISAETTYYEGQGQGFTEVPDDIPDDVSYVVLNSNNITTLRTNQFANLSKCVRILLIRNMITVIQPGAFNWLSTVTEINLDDNIIERSRNTVLVTSTQVHYLSHRTVQYDTHSLICPFAQWQQHRQGRISQ